MAFKELVNEAKKNTPDKMIPSGPKHPENLIEAANLKPLNQDTKQPEKKRFYADTETKELVLGQRTFGSKQNIDSKHGSIIRNITNQSGANLQMSGKNTNWEECKHRKNSNGKDFCLEYHSLCSKNGCKRARK